MSKPPKYNDYSFKEVCKAAAELAASGANVYQKFTCEHCGARQTIDVPNVLYKKGLCEECGHITDIERRGCNYMVHLGPPLPNQPATPREKVRVEVWQPKNTTKH